MTNAALFQVIVQSSVTIIDYKCQIQVFDRLKIVLQRKPVDNLYVAFIVNNGHTWLNDDQEKRSIRHESVYGGHY